MATFNLHAKEFLSILLSEPSEVVAVFCCSTRPGDRVRLWEGLLKQSAVVFTTTSPQLAKVARPKEAVELGFCLNQATARDINGFTGREGRRPYCPLEGIHGVAFVIHD